MKALANYNRGLDAISAHLSELAESRPNGFVVGALDKRTRGVNIHVFDSFKKARRYVDKHVPEPAAAPIVQISSDTVLML